MVEMMRHTMVKEKIVEDIGEVFFALVGKRNLKLSGEEEVDEADICARNEVFTTPSRCL
jgi:hypothetical protein